MEEWGAWLSRVHGVAKSELYFQYKFDYAVSSLLYCKLPSILLV